MVTDSDVTESANSLKVLGKVVGTVDGWDPVDELSHVYYSFRPNDIGMKWLKDWPVAGCFDISINFLTGKVERYDESSNAFSVEVDWSTFNVT